MGSIYIRYGATIILMNGTVYFVPLQSDADILNQLSSHTVHVLSCARGVMSLISKIGESLKYACMQQGSIVIPCQLSQQN